MYTYACLALVLSGKVSPMTTQANGPQVMANDAMKKHAETIIRVPATGFSVGGRAMPTEAKMSSQVACQQAPTIKGMRRPKRSTIQRPGKVVMTLTAPRISWMRMGSSMPADWKIVAPY